MALSLPVFAFVFGMASAIGVALLGGVSILGGRARPRGALAFGLFAILWGVQIALGHVANLVTDEATARILYLLVLVCLIVLPYFLLAFVASQAERPSRRIWVASVVAAAVLGFTNTLLLLAAPELLYGGVVERLDHLLPVWGPLHLYLVTIPFFLAFAVALVALATSARNAPTPRTAERAAVLLAGLGIYVSFAAGNNLVFYLGSLALDGFFPVTFGFVVLFAALAAVVLGIAQEAYRAAIDARTPAERRRHRILALALAAPLAWGMVEGFLAISAFPRLETVGAWRLIGVAVITYGVARWRIYDLPQRATNAAAIATGTTAAVATGAAAYGAGSLASATPAVPVVAGLLVLGAALLPSVQFARRLFGVDKRSTLRDAEAALYGQRIDAYRAALEASLARGSLAEDGEFLAALRERFSITEAEERVLLHYAKSSVIVARDRQAFDAYERLRLLGEGGSGRTWLARDRARDRLVVLKEPLERWQQEPAAREAVLREARVAAKVRHPNVVAVEEVVEGKGVPVIVMEYMDGGSLRDVLRARGTLPWPEARATMLDILRGLEAVHAAGIVHRDVKPSNVLLNADGIAKLADFGIAVTGAASSAARTIVMDTAMTGVAGTLAYMAPEAKAGATPDRRADVYGCAAVLHEMLYGAPPGANSPVVVRRDLPAALAPLLARALAEHPDARVPTARAFADELARIA